MFTEVGVRVRLVKVAVKNFKRQPSRTAQVRPRAHIVICPDKTLDGSGWNFQLLPGFLTGSKPTEESASTKSRK